MQIQCFPPKQLGFAENHLLFIYVSHQKATKKVASYANLGNLLHRTARKEIKEKKNFKIQVAGRTTPPESPLCPSEEPRAPEVLLFVLFSAAPYFQGQFLRPPLAGTARWWQPQPGSGAP